MWFSQGEAYPLHSGCADPCDFPKCGKLDCIICGSGGLRSRFPLVFVFAKSRSKRVWVLPRESRSMGQLCHLSGEMELELGAKPRHDCGTIAHSCCRRLGKHGCRLFQPVEEQGAGFRPCNSRSLPGVTWERLFALRFV